MASVFLSYDRDDAAKARPIAGALEKAGHEVWWDLHVRGGAQFSKVIEEALKASDVVVVLWSANAIESPWVRDEAGAGRDTGRLVPVTLDGTQAPLGFRQFQTIDLSRWKGRGSPAGLRALLDELEARAAGPADAAGATAPVPAKRAKRDFPVSFRPALAIVLIIAILAAAAVVWLIGSSSSGGLPTVAVAPADSASGSRQMARDLMVNLGNLQSVKSGSMTLVDGSDRSSSPDLQFQIADTGSTGKPSAALALLSGKDRGLLWSSDFEQPSGNAADLKQQLTVTAGRVLGCALDGSEDGNRLATHTLKSYLNACAQLADVGDPRPVIPMLRQVTRDAPRFEAAWSKLLLAQATVADLNFNGGRPNEQARSDLRRLIDEARKVSPQLPEADLAEAVLLPPTAYGKALALVDRAARHSPDDPQILSFRSSALAGVGRMDEAVQDAVHAAEMDPLSPALNAAVVTTLAFSGLVEPARKQLDQLEKLWPGTAAARQARYSFYFRYGDPKVALAMPQTQEGTAGVLYLLEARIDPTPANIDRLVKFLRARKDKFGADAGADRLAYYTLAMGQFHQNDELFETLMSWGKPDDLALLGVVYFRPELRELRKEPRFLQVMKRAGLLDYWRTSGKWPDFCFYADMTYDCRKEAAKLK